MARIRTVKPELFRHEGLFEAEESSGLPLRVAFIGLFTICDRRGIFRWQPRQLKLDVMPYDSIDFSRVLDALLSRGFVMRYASGNEEYGLIPSFERHQVINNKEKPALHPSIECADRVFPYSEEEKPTREQRVSNANESTLNPDQGEGKGRERKGTGKEGKGNGKGTVTESIERMMEILPGLSSDSATEYLAYRKAKKAPLTPGAWKALAAEMAKSGMAPDDAINMAMARNWQGFECAWLPGSSSPKGGFQPGLSKQEQIQAANQRVVDEIIARQSAGGDQVDFDLGDPIVIEGEVIRAH